MILRGPYLQCICKEVLAQLDGFGLVLDHSLTHKNIGHLDMLLTKYMFLACS